MSNYEKKILYILFFISQLAFIETLTSAVGQKQGNKDRKIERGKKSCKS